MRDGMTRIARRLIPGVFVLLAGCASEYPQTMLEPITDWGRLQIDLWETVTWWTVGIMVVVFAALAIILVRFRDRPDAPEPKPIYGNTKLEVAWTVAPALIILFIAIPTIRAIFATQAEPPEDALVVEAIGHQWWWEFRYPEYDVVTANEMYVPTNRPIALKLRSADVIHSFWIPRLGGKKDVNPVVRTPEGVEPLHLNQIVLAVDSAGEYLGQCAEYCGTSHAIMRMNAVAVPQREFTAWIEDMKTPVEPAGELAARGKEIFLRSTCIACHTIEGTSAQGTRGPNLTLMGERFSIGAGLMENNTENMAEWIMYAPDLKHGVIMPGTETGAGGMPPTGLSEEDVAAVAAYLSDLRRPLAGRRPAGMELIPLQVPGADTAATDTGQPSDTTLTATAGTQTQQTAGATTGAR